MSVSDKARFFLEQTVPQLQEFKEKKIFTEEEIKTLVKKRSDFEHRILARGSEAVDFARYAAWEISLEHLRTKRCQRLHIKGSAAFTGQARIFQIFDRGTKKRPGDVALWMSYLDYAKDAKAHKKFKTILTSAVRLHPTKPELWLYAAKHALESESDMSGARGYMLQGTRFCTTNSHLWIEYAKLEMIYLAKISMRRRILGLDVDNSVNPPDMDATSDTGFTTSQDIIAIPNVKDNYIQPKMMKHIPVDSEAKDPMNTPALQGAIPIAIFESSRNQKFFCPSAAEEFFNMFMAFTQVQCLPKILQHVLNVMEELYSGEASTCNCYIREPLIGIAPTSADFPSALGVSLGRLEVSMSHAKDPMELSKKTKTWMESILVLEELDPGIRTVLEHTVRTLH